MRNDTGIIAPAALGDVQVGYFGNHFVSHVIAVGNNQMVGVYLADGGCGGFGHFPVQLARNGAAHRMLVVHVFAHAGLVEQVETDQFGRHIFVLFGPHFPMKTEGFQGFGVFP
jgi:hypothetical protein